MSGFDQYVRASSASLSLVDLLQRPVTELLGVGTDAGTALGQIGVETIFDLGSSAVFAAAAAASGELRIPPSVSIARRLIEHWYGGELPGSWSRP